MFARQISKSIPIDFAISVGIASGSSTAVNAKCGYLRFQSSMCFLMRAISGCPSDRYAKECSVPILSSGMTMSRPAASLAAARVKRQHDRSLIRVDGFSDLVGQPRGLAATRRSDNFEGFHALLLITWTDFECFHASPLIT